ncbi:MAG TPA: VOC family protein [Hyphomicrobiales bacterium]|nr:VOC family protein [Hyphomicrobiales bacterium]
MPRMIFVNLPVADLDHAKAFYQQLGFTCNPEYTDHTAACMVLSDTIFVMLLTHDKFATFSPHPICDAHKNTEVLNALSCESREEVDTLVSTAVAQGGARYSEPKDYGFMYQHGFQDPDGHVWELIYMAQQ